MTAPEPDRKPRTRGAGPPAAWDLAIVVDGEPPASGWRHLLTPSAIVIAADGGARYAFGEGVSVTDVVGDLDSLTPTEVDALAHSGSRIHRFDADKDYTDFELAARLVHDGHGTPGTPLLVVGGAGGRLDHALGNIAVLGSDELTPFPVTALLGEAVVRVATPAHPVTVHGGPDRLVSLVPAGGPVSGVTTSGLRYELAGETMGASRARGISNVVERPPATVATGAGALLVIEPGTTGRLIRRHDPTVTTRSTRTERARTP